MSSTFTFQLGHWRENEVTNWLKWIENLQEWCKTRNADLRIRVPQCYFAKYHNTEPQVEGDDGSTFSDAESVLVLEDMRPNGFSMRDFNCGLSLDEAFAAIREIATIHALSWAMQETDVALDDKWEFAYRPQKAASAYKVGKEKQTKNLTTPWLEVDSLVPTSLNHSTYLEM